MRRSAEDRFVLRCVCLDDHPALRGIPPGSAGNLSDQLECPLRGPVIRYVERDVREDDPDKPILVKRIEKRLLKNWRDLRVKAKAELDLMKRGDRR